MIRIEDVSFSYHPEEQKTQPALSHVSLTVAPGEFVALVGHNGCGKSTLCKLFNGLLTPSVGNVWVEEINTRDQDRLIQIRQAVGMVFQNPDNQIIGSTVEDDVAFGPENIGCTPAETNRRVNEAIKLLSLDSIRHEPPHLLSGGQKQRVALAGVLAMRPRYMILDEPTSLLDPAGRTGVLKAVVSLCRSQGIAVILVTHFMDEVIAADRVVVMEAGKPVLAGTPQEVFRQAERLRELQLDVPLVTLVAEGLRKRGIACPDHVLTIEELTRHLCLL